MDKQYSVNLTKCRDCPLMVWVIVSDKYYCSGIRDYITEPDYYIDDRCKLPDA